MKLTNTENKIKDLLTDANAPIDAQAIWDKIEDRAPKKKSTNRKLILWFTLGFIALISSPLWYTVSPSKKGMDHKNMSLEDKSFAQEPSLKLEKSKEEIITDNFNNSTETRSDNNPATSASKNLGLKKQLTYSTSRTSSNPIDKTAFQETQSINPSLSLLTSDSNTERSLDKILTLKNSNQETRTASDLMILNLSPLVYQRQLQHSPPLIDIRKKAIKSKTAFTIGVGSIISTSKAQIKNTSPEFDPSILYTESNLPGLTLSFQLSRKLRDNLSIYAGLHLGQTVSRIQDNSSQIISELDTTLIYTDADLHEFTEVGLVDTYQITNDIQWHRRHLNIDLEAGINLMLYRFKKFSISTSSGIQLSLAQNNGGYYFDQTTGQTLKPDIGYSHYKEGIDYGLHVGLDLGWNLDQVSFGIKPTFRMYKNQLLPQSSVYNVSKTQLGIQFTTTYRPSWVD